MLQDDTEASETAARLQLQDLRQSTLTLFLATVFVVPFLWLVHISAPEYQGGVADAAALATIASAGLAFGLKQKHFVLASWVFILGGCLAECFLLLIYTDSIIVTIIGGLLIISANAVLGARQALVAAFVVSLCQVVTLHFARDVSLTSALPFEWLVANGLVWGASYLAVRPLETTTAWSLAGWQRARDLLEETRRRREELYGVVRSLEEASYRIERMNNELLLAKNQADEARASKSHLAATVSHELRAPLNLILGFSQLIALYPEKYGAPLPASYYADIDIIYRNSQYLVALIDDILDISRIEAERLPLVKDRVDFQADIVDKVVAAVGGLAERKGLYLQQRIPADLPWVLADPVRMRQTLTNLVINAIRFTETGGITVSVERAEQALIVSVNDTGIGISREHLPKLFQEFSQIVQTGTHEAGGTGLGLAISKQLVLLHGGEIWAESGIGRGTTIFFSLPLPNVPGAAIPFVTPPRSTARLHDICLVVHDDPDFVRLIARHVERYHVVGAAQPQDVARTVQDLHPAAIITSPGLAGRVKEQLEQLPYEIALISVNSRGPIGGRAFTQGVSYLSKPITNDMLRAIMGRADHGQAMTILIVDDDPDFVRLLADMLTLLPHRYRILRAHDGEQALGIMKETRPDLVFLDLVLPVLNGEQTLQAMREDPQLAAVPVVIMSAQILEEAIVKVVPPISLHAGPEMDPSKAAHVLTELIDAARPSYLQTEEADGRRGAGLPG
jgi:signal transduction histidine kinase/CheY-like chemotaxis protein